MLRGRELRLVPVVIMAVACLFVLKAAGLVLDGGYVLTGARVAQAQTANQPSWAQQMFNFPDGSGNSSSSGSSPTADSPPPSAGSRPPGGGASRPPVAPADARSDQSGGTARVDPPTPPKNAPAPAAPANAAAGSDGKAAPNGTKGPANGAKAAAESAPAKPPDKATPAADKAAGPANAASVKIETGRPGGSPGERALLERLQERRQELETRGRDLDLREGLLKAAEKRLESRIGELKEMESRVAGGLQKKEQEETSRFKNLITMYENMKAKEAARIFDRLDLRILVDVARQMNPRRMSDIMAQMTPEAAERLTVELANRASDRPQSTADLPKIEGRPTNN